MKLMTQHRAKHARHFLGQILNVDGNADFSIKFVRQCRLEDDKFVFPVKKDVADIDIEQIVGKVEPSTILRKRVLEFGTELETGRNFRPGSETIVEGRGRAGFGS